MPIDFAALVLGPAMTAFARPNIVTPTVSQPGVPPYPARGVFAQKQIQVRLDEGVFTDVQPTLGIQLSDFPVTPKRGDIVVIGTVTWSVRDILPDGQGGADLILAESDSS